MDGDIRRSSLFATHQLVVDVTFVPIDASAEPYVVPFIAFACSISERGSGVVQETMIMKFEGIGLNRSDLPRLVTHAIYVDFAPGSTPRRKYPW